VKNNYGIPHGPTVQLSKKKILVERGVGGRMPRVGKGEKEMGVVAFSEVRGVKKRRRKKAERVCKK
jgi:hypothetical protein